MLYKENWIRPSQDVKFKSLIRFTAKSFNSKRKKRYHDTKPENNCYEDGASSPNVALQKLKLGLPLDDVFLYIPYFIRILLTLTKYVITRLSQPCLNVFSFVSVYEKLWECTYSITVKNWFPLQMCHTCCYVSICHDLLRWVMFFSGSFYSGYFQDCV